MALSEFDQKYLNQAQQKEILAATQRYDAAKAVGDQAGMAAANRQAEAVRAAAGYSGGTDGSGYIKTGGATAQLPKVQAVSVPKADTAALEKQLKETLEASKTQAGAAVDAQVDQSVRELQQAQQISAAGFDAQRDRIDLEEAMAKDAQALYAEVRGDRGGIGAAQYDSISNTAAQNRLAVSREQRQLAADTAAKIAQLRTQGEYEKADKALELTQDYLGRLTSLAQWAAEYDLSAAKFQESVSQWRAEYEAEQRKLEGQLQEQSAQQPEAVRKNLAQTGKTLLELGIMPSSSQMAALGMDENQARSYLSVVKAAAAGKGSTKGKTASSGSVSKTSAVKNHAMGEYALYLDAMESAGDPRTYVKSHYKAYGLAALPEASAYERWRSGLAEPMGGDGFRKFLGKLEISLSEDPLNGTNAMTARHWPVMTAAQRQSTAELYEKYGKSYVYGS